MEFYNLYCRIRKHTGWYVMMRRIDRIFRKEYYDMLELKRRKSVEDFSTKMFLIGNYINSYHRRYI